MELYFHDISLYPEICNSKYTEVPCILSEQWSPAIQSKLHNEHIWSFREAFSSPTCDLVIFCSSNVIGDARLNYRWDDLKV